MNKPINFIVNGLHLYSNWKAPKEIDPVVEPAFTRLTVYVAAAVARPRPPVALVNGTVTVHRVALLATSAAFDV